MDVVNLFFIVCSMTMVTSLQRLSLCQINQVTGDSLQLNLTTVTANSTCCCTINSNTTSSCPPIPVFLQRDCLLNIKPHKDWVNGSTCNTAGQWKTVDCRQDLCIEWSASLPNFASFLLVNSTDIGNVTITCGAGTVRLPRVFPKRGKTNQNTIVVVVIAVVVACTVIIGVLIACYFVTKRKANKRLTLDDATTYRRESLDLTLEDISPVTIVDSNPPSVNGADNSGFYTKEMSKGKLPMTPTLRVGVLQNNLVADHGKDKQGSPFGKRNKMTAKEKEEEATFSY